MKRIRDSLSIVLTSNCDCRCRHCYMNSEPGTARDLDTSFWSGVLRRFAENQGKDVCFHGGEPLLHTGFARLLAEARGLGLAPSIVTNALNLNREIVQLLAETDAYVLVSLDGPRENYYAFRGVDKFEQAVAGIEQLIAAGITVQPIQVVHKDSLSQLGWVADFCSLHGIATCTLSPIQPIGRAEAIEHLLLSGDELAQFVYKLSVLNARGRTKFVTQSVYGPDELERFETARNRIIGFNDDFFYVHSDGVIVCDFDLPDSRAFVLGHANDLTSLSPDVWQRYQDLLAAAFEQGRARLKAGQAVNWHELVQRQAGALRQN